MEFIKDLIKTRGGQLVSRYAGVGLAALAVKMNVVLSPEDSAGFANVIGVAVVALIMFGIDHWSHAKQNS